MEVSPTHRQIEVVESSQPSAARFAAHEMAGRAGFANEDIHRAGLIATELATNLVKHATGGEMLVRDVSRGPDPEIELIAIDRGPGIADIGRSLADGHSTSGTPGNGLGAVQRLADAFDIHSQLGVGTVVLARLRTRRSAGPAKPRLEVAGISVPKRGETLCGDAWQVHHYPDGALAVVADGLGHGLHASEASSAAVAVVDPRNGRELSGMLQDMHSGLRHTRGAAAAIADIRPGSALMKYAGVGNISGTICDVASTRHTVSHNGTLGHVAPQFREYSYPWTAGATLVMHSDGLVSHWTLDRYRGLSLRHPAVVAAVLYRDFSRQRDDVTVLVGREAART
jgi:anti-sigma regulatory factor (Ser/Thr protein kinase)